MAYSTAQSPRVRAITLGTVAAIHLAAGYALVTGLGGVLIERILPTRLPTVFVPLPKPHPTATPEPTEQTQTRPPPIGDPIRDPIQQRMPTFDPGPMPGPSGAGDIGKVKFPDPVPSAAPTPAPLPEIAAHPRGNLADWVSTSDYPSGELRAEHAGAVRFRLTIDSNGRVSSCTVTGSSGWPGLDSATCALLTRRARFSPASDQTGAPVEGSYSGAVRWKIPE